MGSIKYLENIVIVNILVRVYKIYFSIDNAVIINMTFAFRFGCEYLHRIAKTFFRDTSVTENVQLL